jgi:curli biogenesis system outer membrane secretion channel CsgG
MTTMRFHPALLAAALLAAVTGVATPPAAAGPALQEPAAAEVAATEQAIPIAVLPLGLTEETRRRYPQLAERNVGFGIHNLLVDLLYDTGGFRFVEDKPEVVEDLVQRQWVASTGAVDVGSAVRYGRLLGARYVVYGEVFDFSTRKLKRRTAETRIGIQIRLVDVETSEYVPASATGVVTVKGETFPKGDGVEFARGTVGQATSAALAQAVPQLMERFAKFRAAGEGG